MFSLNVVPSKHSPQMWGTESSMRILNRVRDMGVGTWPSADPVGNTAISSECENSWNTGDVPMDEVTVCVTGLLTGGTVGRFDKIAQLLDVCSNSHCSHSCGRKFELSDWAVVPHLSAFELDVSSRWKQKIHFYSQIEKKISNCRVIRICSVLTAKYRLFFGEWWEGGGGCGFIAAHDYFTPFEPNRQLGTKREIPEKYHQTTCKHNLACITCDVSWARTYSHVNTSDLQH